MGFHSNKIKKYIVYKIIKTNIFENGMDSERQSRSCNSTLSLMTKYKNEYFYFLFFIM